MNNVEIPKVGDTWYRYDYVRMEDRVSVYQQEYEVVALTPKGCWLSRWYGAKKKWWVSYESRKKFAWPDKHRALESFSRRKHRQIEILEHQIKSAQAAEKAALAMLEKKEYEEGYAIAKYLPFEVLD